MVFPFTKTSFRGETSGGVYCEQALCLGKGENESQEEGFVHPFLERACSQVSGMVASQKVGCFLRLQKFRLKIPAGGLSQTRGGEALRLPYGWKLQPSHAQICPLLGVNSEFSPLVPVSLTLEKT